MLNASRVRVRFLRLVLSFCAGVTHVGGDMFNSIPNGDAIFMKVN